MGRIAPATKHARVRDGHRAVETGRACSCTGTIRPVRSDRDIVTVFRSHRCARPARSTMLSAQSSLTPFRARAAVGHVHRYHGVGHRALRFVTANSSAQEAVGRGQARDPAAPARPSCISSRPAFARRHPHTQGLRECHHGTIALSGSTNGAALLAIARDARCQLRLDDFTRSAARPVARRCAPSGR